VCLGITARLAKRLDIPVVLGAALAHVHDVVADGGQFHTARPAPRLAREQLTAQLLEPSPPDALRWRPIGVPPMAWGDGARSTVRLTLARCHETSATRLGARA